MAFELIPETGAGVTNANSYCSRAFADSYHEARLHAEKWQEADELTKDKALAMATRLLDDHVEWRGVPVLTREYPAWPRDGMADRGGAAIVSTTLPTCVQEATAELARRLLEQDRAVLAEDAPLSQSAGGRSRSYGQGRRAAVIPPAVTAKIDHLIIRGASRLVRAA